MIKAYSKSKYLKETRWLFMFFSKGFVEKFSTSFSAKKRKNIFKLLLFFCLMVYGSVIAFTASTQPVSSTQATALTNDAENLFFNAIPLALIFLNFLETIVTWQLNAVGAIQAIDFNAGGTFDFIIPFLKWMAIIGSVIKIWKHYYKTERFDTVQSVLGFFPYIGMILLLFFSKPVIGYMVSQTQSVNTAKIESVSTTLKNELVKTMEADYERFSANKTTIGEFADFMTSGSWNEFAFGIAHQFKYAFFSLMGSIVSSCLAMPALIIAFMTKVMLALLLAASGMIFLVSFIPGFEDTWKSYMLSILNVMLWIPIFNYIVVGVIQIITTLITEDSMTTGTIIVIAILAVALAYQSITLTFTASSAIISSAASGTGSVLGGLASMNGASMAGKAFGVAAGAALLIATKGTSAAASKKRTG